MRAVTSGRTIGTRFVAKATPDGYTILLSYTGTLAIGATMYAQSTDGSDTLPSSPEEYAKTLIETKHDGTPSFESSP